MVISDLCDIEVLMKYMALYGLDELTVGDVKLIKRRASWNIDQKEQVKKEQDNELDVLFHSAPGGIPPFLRKVQ